ncbi:MAG: hypothetical protein JW737_09840 [Acidobacteria bacterium]|nr:hypothetical protein [Acidobacteriota bacterium]
MKKKLLLTILLLVGILFTACETHNNVGQTRAGVYMTVDEILWQGNAGSLGLTRTENDQTIVYYESDQANITLSNRPKNAATTTSSWLDIQIQEYQVTFYRIDGGTKVPNSLRRGITYIIPFNGSADLSNLTLLSAQQKAETPLWELGVNGYDTETGNAVIEVNVLVEFFGEQMSGETVYASGWTSIAWPVYNAD